MDEKKFLIVNADDFGLSSGVNRGIVEAYEMGIVTSASLMVRWSASGDAATYGRVHPNLSLGLHLDLGEWSYSEGEWIPEYEVVDLTDADAVANEVVRQIEEFRRLVGRDPTHIDSHQHVHLKEPAKSFLLRRAQEVGIPLRHFIQDVRYCGDFYGQTAEGVSIPQTISVEALIKILDDLPPGWTELACHPGYSEGLQTMYQNERELELKVLCDSRILNHLKKLSIKLRSFGHPIPSA